MNSAKRNAAMTESHYDTIIIGAGHNGLVAGFYLARAGMKVLLCERRGFVGGACATEEFFDGYRISTCAYVNIGRASGRERV